MLLNVVTTFRELALYFLVLYPQAIVAVGVAAVEVVVGVRGREIGVGPPGQRGDMAPQRPGRTAPPSNTRTTSTLRAPTPASTRRTLRRSSGGS